MKFLLTSSGLQNSVIADALSALVGKPLSETALLFVPTAANTGTEDKGWLIENLVQFQRYNFKSIDIVDIATPAEVWKPHFLIADVVCLGGGDEKYLARVMKETQFKEFIVPLLTSKVYMGISAGSMVVGHFLPLGLSAEVFPEESFGGEEVTTMNLCDIVFIPHLNSGWFKKVRKEFLETLKDKLDRTTYAADDETALRIDGENTEVVGEGEHWLYKK